MKKRLLIAGLVCLVVFGQVSCDFDIGNYNTAGVNSGTAVNPSRAAEAYEEVDFLSYAMPMVFGPSVSGGNTNPIVAVVKGPFAGNPVGGLYSNEPIPEGYIELCAINNGGKIAGSEDGIAFFFKEVDASKNFKIEAEFIIRSFGINPDPDPNIMGTKNDRALDSNGQEAWGIMARDFVPEWGSGGGSMTMEAIRTRMNTPHPSTGEMQISLKNRSSTGYLTGTRGGDSNMIMVGGVKRGVRMYYREGVKYNGYTPLRRFDEASGGYINNLESGNPTENKYQDASQSRFYFLPRELGDYTPYTSDDGYPTLAARPDFPEWNKIGFKPAGEDVEKRWKWESTYFVRLEKTNNGFDYLIKPPDESHLPQNERTGKETISTYPEYVKAESLHKRVPLYDILDSVNKEKYYVGFFAARGARVWVKISSIKYWEADAEDCDPYIEPNPETVSATLEVVSPEFYTGNKYLYVKSNVNGELVVTQDGTRIPTEVIYQEWVVEKENGSGLPHTLWTIPTLDYKTGANIFSLTFYPDNELPPELKNSGAAGKVLASTTSINRTFIVTKKLYQNGTGDIYVSAGGRSGNNGTVGSPLDLQTAINYVQPGQTIIMENGIYNMNKFVSIVRYNDGRMDARKTLKAKERNKVIIDFNKNIYLEDANQGFLMGGNYWTLDGFHVRNTPNKTKGLVVAGHNNVMSYLMTYNNGDTGFQLSGSASEPKRYWPSGNTIEYCESFNNMDGAQTDADGFASKLTVGKDNQFLWCISHNNNDDGWDLFTKKETGAIGIVKFYGCVSYENKRMLNGYETRAGGNGFKLGGEGISIRHEIRQCLSFLSGSKASPIMSNSNPGLDVYYCTAIGESGRGVGSINITSGDNTTPEGMTRLEARQNSVYAGNGSVTNTDFESVLFSLRELYGIETSATAVEIGDGSTYPISDLKKFLDRKPDGRPDLRDVYKPAGDEWATGAWAFYVDQKPVPNFVNF